VQLLPVGWNDRENDQVSKRSFDFAGGKPCLGPLQCHPPCSQELVDGCAGLIGVAPVGVLDFVVQLGRLRFVGLGLEQVLEPGSLAVQQRSRLGLVHPCLVGSGVKGFIQPKIVS
jgi:hypothetical protein